LNYEWDSDIVLAVDTSWMAVGIEIYQLDPEDLKRKFFAKFDSIPLNEREARFSQPKRELYGLLRALLHMQYWLLGCRKLVIETDAMYIKGMLNNPGMGPNATINRWIEQILMFHFELKHVRGMTFSPDGLSRRRKQPGDPDYPNPGIGYDDNPPPEDHNEWDYDIPQPLEFEDFKNEIDTRGGYLQDVVDPEFEFLPDFEVSMDQFQQDCKRTYQETLAIDEAIKEAYAADGRKVPQYLMSQIQEEEKLLPDTEFKFEADKREPYPEEHRNEAGRI
jgi:hypothetical protein